MPDLRYFHSESAIMSRRTVGRYEISEITLHKMIYNFGFHHRKHYLLNFSEIAMAYSRNSGESWRQLQFPVAISFWNSDTTIRST